MNVALCPEGWYTNGELGIFAEAFSTCGPVVHSLPSRISIILGLGYDGSVLLRLPAAPESEKSSQVWEKCGKSMFLQSQKCGKSVSGFPEIRRRMLTKIWSHVPLLLPYVPGSLKPHSFHTQCDFPQPGPVGGSFHDEAWGFWSGSPPGRGRATNDASSRNSVRPGMP